VTERPATLAHPDPRIAAVLDQMTPYLTVAGAVSLLSSPAEIILPIVRRVRGRTGVAIGPALVIVANATSALALAHLLRRRPGTWAALKRSRVRPWYLVVPLYVLLSPLLGAGWERAVVLRGRSALWGGLVSSSGLVQIVVLVVTIARARRARRTAS
jgi:hypothetical protein